MNFEGKKILIMGLGLHGGGVSVARFFVSRKARVAITDLKNESQLEESLEKLKSLDVKLVLGKHKEENFKNADLIIKNPAVPSNSPFLKIARENNIAITDDISLFFDLCPCEIIGITGTKGKSTTATLTYELIKDKYHTILAGNIGISPLEYLDDLNKESKVILELSSFALENLNKSPHIAVITNLFPDHLNRYESFNDYVEAKKNIFKYQNENDILILNKADENSYRLRSEARGEVEFFEKYNAAAAGKIAEILGISDEEIIRKTKGFKGVSHRQELIGEINEVKYFNDTAATNPGAVKYALEFLKKSYPGSNIILIAGGEDKKLSYRAMADDIQDNVKSLILLPGSASELIKRDLKKFDYYEEKNMKDCVKKASQLAKRGDVVILSPGAASFNLFKNEFDRGFQFIEAVKELPKK